MSLKNSKLITDLLEENELPTVQTVVTVDNESIWKLTLALILVVAVSALIISTIRSI